MTTLVPPTILDRMIAAIAPRNAVRRLAARRAFEALAAIETRSLGYEGAASGRRTSGWRARNSSADVEIALAGAKLRARSRDLTRNNPHAAKAVDVWVNNIVGHGFEPRAATGDDARDRAIDALWAEWSASCDADGRGDFHALTGLAVREMVEGGDVFARRRVRRFEDGLAAPLQIQLLEADHLDESKTSFSPAVGIRTVRGIEYDAVGGRSAYWLFVDHPGEHGLGMRRLESERVPAETIAHLFRRDRIQQRGVPWAAPVIHKLRELDDWTEAELVRKKLEACMLAFVIDPEGGDAPLMTPASPGALDADSRAVDAGGNPVENFEPGLIAYLRGGKDVRFNDPKSTGGVSEWLSAQLHIVAAGHGMPYELLTGDLSGVNYSSIRAGFLEFRRRVDALQWQLVIPCFTQPIWDWFIEAAFDAGRIDAPRAKVEWAPPKFEEVDRVKEALADLAEIRSGTMTLAQAIARKGYNPEEQLAEIARVNAIVDTLGLTLDSDPRKVSRAGLTQARPEGSVLPEQAAE